MLQTFAEEHGFVVRDSIAVDSDHNSGEDLWARKWLLRVLKLSLTTKRKTLLLQDWSILASSSLEILILHQQLTDLGLQVVAIEGDLPKVSRSAMTAMTLSVSAGASLEKARTAAVLQIGRRSAMVRNGRCGGNPRYGELSGERQIMDRIIALHEVEKLGYSAIAKRLNLDGVRPRRAEAWTPTTIASLLGARRAKRARESTRKPSSTK